MADGIDALEVKQNSSLKEHGDKRLAIRDTDECVRFETSKPGRQILLDHILMIFSSYAVGHLRRDIPTMKEMIPTSTATDPLPLESRVSLASVGARGDRTYILRLNAGLLLVAKIGRKMS